MPRSRDGPGRTRFAENDDQSGQADRELPHSADGDPSRRPERCSQLRGGGEEGEGAAGKGRRAGGTER